MQCVHNHSEKEIMFYGCETNPMNQPIEEKWKETFSKKFGITSEKQEIPPKTFEMYGEIESFIENLLEQDRQRMSDEVEGLHKRSAEFEDFSSATVDEVLSIINK